jgi:type IV pilus assembly protein PilM
MRLGRRDTGATSCRHGHTIGLDLGATAARVVVLRTTTLDGVRGTVLEQAGGVVLPPGTVVNGAVADPGTLTSALKRLWKEQHISCRHVVLGIAGPQVQVRTLQVPDLDPARRAQSLPFQAREVVALPIDTVVLDFAPRSAAAEDTGLVDGLLVASPREPVQVAVAAVEAAGLKVDRVDLASFAVLRSIAQEGLASEAVIDLGAHLTTVVVHRDGVPVMVRTLARGGEEITSKLAERLEIGWDTAEELKREHGLDGSDETTQVLRDLVVPLLADIRTSLNYFRSSNAGVRIEQVTLTGGGALLPGLAEVLETQVGAPTSVQTPGASSSDPATSRPGIPSPRDGVDPSWASAQGVGLAIRAAA